MVRKLFRGHKVAVVGLSFKVCLVDGIEVATFRKGFSVDPAVETVSNTTETEVTIHDDLACRDLTINAMAICPFNGTVVDDWGGQEDLRNRIIRFTGNPYDRIAEDPCRIIRACRFKAKFAGTFHPETLEALKAKRQAVAQVAPERIRLELMKALTCARPSRFFNALHDIGVLPSIAPGLEACYGHDGGQFHGETIDEHLAIAGDSLSANRPLLRLAGYYHDIGKVATAEYTGERLSFLQHEKVGAEMVVTELTALKFSLKEIDYVSALVRQHMRLIQPSDKPRTVRRFLKKLHDDKVDWRDWLRLKIADAKGNLNKDNLSQQVLKDIVSKIYRELYPQSGEVTLTISGLAINGADIMLILGKNEGSEIGQILQQTLEYVLDEPQRNERETLVAFLKGL